MSTLSFEIRSNKYVKDLQKLKIPLVIATHFPISDKKATEFAISFYRSLVSFNTVEGAFNKARGVILAMDDQLDIPRGLNLDLESNGDVKACWGFYGLDQRKQEAKWRLSNDASIEIPNDYQPNATLIHALMLALMPYCPEVANMLLQEKEGRAVSKIAKREEILKALPQPMSEMVRKLLVENTGSDDIFYDQPGKHRLDQLCRVFFITQELMGFIMLAQLWEILAKNPELEISQPTKNLLREALLSDSQQSTYMNYVDLIRSIRLLLDAQKQSYFVDELADLKDLIQENTAFSQAVLFFEDLTTHKDEMSENQAKMACVSAEEHLAKFMSYVGFVARYTLTSIKNIEVMKYRHQQSPRFKHRIFKLEMRLGGLAEEIEDLEQVLDNSSVILIKKTGKGNYQFLNLSPFVIDRNAFEDTKAKIPQLYFFERYLQTLDNYEFRHIFKQDSLPFKINPKDNYQLIGAQFDAFAKLLFHQPMRNIL